MYQTGWGELSLARPMAGCKHSSLLKSAPQRLLAGIATDPLRTLNAAE
jgi:hypothetical protein